MVGGWEGQVAAWDWLVGCAAARGLAGAGWWGSGVGEGLPAVAHALSCARSQPTALGPARPLPAPNTQERIQRMWGGRGLPDPPGHSREGPETPGLPCGTRKQGLAWASPLPEAAGLTAARPGPGAGGSPGPPFSSPPAGPCPPHRPVQLGTGPSFTPHPTSQSEEDPATHDPQVLGGLQAVGQVLLCNGGAKSLCSPKIFPPMGTNLGPRGPMPAAHAGPPRRGHTWNPLSPPPQLQNLI